MARVAQFSHEFADQIPEALSEGKLYVSMRFGVAIHLCACGCRKQTVTPIAPDEYKLIFDGETITLHPSVGNWNFPCGSHYLICKDQVIWVDDWTADQATAFRARDRYLKGQPCTGQATGAADDPALTAQGDPRATDAGSTRDLPQPGWTALARRIAASLRIRR
jgi:hypothetical protein